MLDESIHQLIVDAGETLNLDPAIVEKDYYVTGILHTLASLNDQYSRLVFSGGTALAKAHHLVQRMSEDVDFKFQKTAESEGLSKTKYLMALKDFRGRIISTLEQLENVKATNMAVRNEGQYMRLHIEYDSVFTSNQQLRPHILLEFTASHSQLPTQDLPINALMHETFNLNHLSIAPPLTCISAEETAAEKWVGLTRRIASIERGYHPDDKTLIRHVYDLAKIREAHPFSDQFFALVEQVIVNDATQFKNRHHQYVSNPIKEIQYSLEILKNKSEWGERYNHFMEQMVYDKNDKHSYKDSIAVLEQLSDEIIKKLSLDNINRDVKFRKQLKSGV